MEWINTDPLELFGKVCDVVGQSKEVLNIFIRTHLARHFELRSLIVDRALAFDREQVLVGDAVDENDLTINFEIVGCGRQVLRRHI